MEYIRALSRRTSHRNGSHGWRLWPRELSQHREPVRPGAAVRDEPQEVHAGRKPPHVDTDLMRPGGQVRRLEHGPRATAANVVEVDRSRPRFRELEIEIRNRASRVWVAPQPDVG